MSSQIRGKNPPDRFKIRRKWNIFIWFRITIATEWPQFKKCWKNRILLMWYSAQHFCRMANGISEKHGSFAQAPRMLFKAPYSSSFLVCYQIDEPTRMDLFWTPLKKKSSDPSNFDLANLTSQHNPLPLVEKLSLTHCYLSLPSQHYQSTCQYVSFRPGKSKKKEKKQ